MSIALIIVCCAAVGGLVATAVGSRLHSRGGFWLVVGLVALAVAAGLFGKFGGLGFGTGGGSGNTGPDAARAPANPKPPPPDTRPKPPTRPLKITIDNREYFVAERKVTLEEITEMLGKIPDGSGPAVVVTRADDSRPPAEIKLRKLLVERKISDHWPQ